MAEQKPEITYPCEWPYRIIGTSEVPIRNSVSSILGDKNYTLVASKKSSGGKYISFALSLIVDSEEERLEIFEELKMSNEIKMVL